MSFLKEIKLAIEQISQGQNPDTSEIAKRIVTLTEIANLQRLPNLTIDEMEIRSVTCFVKGQYTDEWGEHDHEFEIPLRIIKARNPEDECRVFALEVMEQEARKEMFLASQALEDKKRQFSEISKQLSAVRVAVS